MKDGEQRRSGGDLREDNKERDLRQEKSGKINRVFEQRLFANTCNRFILASFDQLCQLLCLIMWRRLRSKSGSCCFCDLLIDFSYLPFKSIHF